MSIIKALFSQDGSISMMRVMSLICCLAAVVIAIIGLMKAEPNYDGLAILCTSFLSAAFAGKVLQKNIEIKDKPQ